MPPEGFGFWSLVPAIVTILAAVITREVALALFLGIFSGSLVFTSFAWGAGFSHFGGLIAGCFADIERLKMALFLVLVGAMLEMIAVSGAFQAFADWMSRSLNTPRKIRLSAYFLGLGIFFDDYANLLITGATMRAVAARNRMSPALLAYIVDNVAMIVSLMLLSTWAAFESSVILSAAESIKLAGTGVGFFIASLPYHFSTYLCLVLVFLTAYNGCWFGNRFDVPEKIGAEAEITPHEHVSVRHALVPLLALVGVAVAGLSFFGAFNWLAGPADIGVSEILADLPTIDVLLFSTVLALGLCLLQLREHGICTYGELSVAGLLGMARMVSPSLVILWAKGLSGISAELGTGLYIVGQIGGYVIPQALPLFAFIMAGLITIATGFSWSSMAIVMPVAFQMAQSQQVLAAIPMISAAVISGSILGGLLIPYSDTSVMAAAATGISPLRHVKTQAGQALLAGTAAVICYGAHAWGFGTPASYFFGLVFLGAVHAIFSRPSPPM
jgi:Na+/H+ antiporter NhaC